MTPNEIRALRERLGLSRADFAGRLGVTERAVHFWEAGRRTPGGATLILLANLAKASSKKGARES
jgi:putative transcriptional regulator